MGGQSAYLEAVHPVSRLLTSPTVYFIMISSLFLRNPWSCQRSLISARNCRRPLRCASPLSDFLYTLNGLGDELHALLMKVVASSNRPYLLNGLFPIEFEFSFNAVNITNGIFPQSSPVKWPHIPLGTGCFFPKSVTIQSMARTSMRDVNDT